MTVKYYLRRRLYQVYRIWVSAITFIAGNTNYKKIILIGNPRTGSNLLISYLNSHPHIEMEGEIFNHLKEKTSSDLWREIFLKKAPWIKYFGFKLFYEQPVDADRNGVWDLIKKDKDIRVIHLIRENALRTYVSHLISRKANWWTQSIFEKVPEIDKKVKIEIEDCISAIEHIEQEIKLTRETFHNKAYYEMKYENLVENPNKELNDLFAFLGLKFANIQTNMMKQNPEPLQKLVSNYKELVMALKKADYHHFTDW